MACRFIGFKYPSFFRNIQFSTWLQHMVLNTGRAVVLYIAMPLFALASTEPMIVAPHIDGYTVNDAWGSYGDPIVAIKESRAQPWCYATSGCWSYHHSEADPTFQYKVRGYWLWTYASGGTSGPTQNPTGPATALISCPTGYMPAVSAPPYYMGMYFVTPPYQKYHPTSLWNFTNKPNPYSPPYFAACIRSPKTLDPSPARAPGDPNPHRSAGGCADPSAPESAEVGNPCNAATGNKYEHETDFAATGPSALSLKRYYNSVPAPSGLFDKWRSNYDGRVVTNPAGTADPDYYRFPDVYLNQYLMYQQPLLRSVALVRPDGKTFWFTQWSGGAWTSDPDVPGTLTSTGSGWAYILRDGTVETYDNSGRLQRITDRAGLSQTLFYDSTGKLDSVTDAFGHVLRFGYDSSTGQLATLTNPAGQITRYSYSGTNLARVDYPNGTAKLYHYEDGRFTSHLTGISHVEANGAVNRYATFTYEASGKAASTEHAGGMEKFTLSYYQFPDTFVTDAIGTQWVLSFSTAWGVRNLTQKSNRSDSKRFKQVFDSRNNLICKANEQDQVVTYAYNDTNQKVSETIGRTGTCSAPVNTSATRTTTYQYLTPTLDLPTIIQSSSVAGGSNIKQVSIAYDSQRNPITITQSGYTPSGNAISRTVTLEYNAQGQVTSLNGPRTDVNDITSLEYNTCTNGGGCGQLRRITNALGQVTSYDSYDANGRLLQITDPNGLVTMYTYDPRGRVSLVTQASGTGSRTTSYSYNTAGDVIRAVLPTGLSITYTYDAALKLRRVQDSLGNYIDYGYDLKGNRTQTFTYDTSGTLVRSVESAFNFRNQIIQINNGGSITKQVWDAIGNLTSVKDPNTVAKNGNIATMNFYDSLNRLLKTVDCEYALSTTCFLETSNTQYNYDPNDRLKTVTAPNGSLTQYQYDDLGNLLQETSPDRGTTTYAYDAAGNLVSQTDARGITVAYTYDALNRLTQMDYPGSAEDVTYLYDALSGSSDCALGIGRLCQVSDAGGSSLYSYDGFGNLVTERRTELGVNYTTRYTYDAGNRLTSMTYPNGRQVNYTRTTKGDIQATSMTLNGVTTSLLNAVSYRPDGLPLTLSFGNNLTDTRTYDTQGRLTYQSIGTADTRLYSYDPNGNLTRLQSLPQVGTYTYDVLDRLKQEDRTTQGTITTTWTYDLNGNRKTQNLGTYAYLANSNRLQTTPTGTITLDAMGNTTSDGSRSYSYNQAGQLAQVNGATYSYNAKRQRSRKVVGAQATVYHYDLSGNLITETDANGNLIRDYVWVNSTPIAQVEAGEHIRYLHSDHLNTPRLATNASGVKVWGWEGEAFGATQPTGSITVNLRFPGQYFDAESGLHYNWNRYYDPKLGRFVTSDPIGLAGGLNTYTYVGNSPLNFIDPYGLFELPSLPQGVMDFSAGMGDVILFGQGQNLRDLVGVDGGINKCSAEYGSGEWAGVAASLATGVAGGIRAAGARGAGMEFSHAIPARWGGARTIWNGNYVTTAQHALSDPYRYQFMSRAWKAENPLSNWASRMWERTPNTWLGTGAVAGYGGAGMAANGCGCRQ